MLLNDFSGKVDNFFSKGPAMGTDSERKRVLFLCTGNSCRSQMAEAWTRRLLGAKVDTFSAGTKPKAVDQRAIAVMDELGLEMNDSRAKHVDEVQGPFDLVVTVCDHANEVCPVVPGARRMVHHGFDDPPALAQDAESEEAALVEYRRVRDEIRAFVEYELPSLLGVQLAGIKIDVAKRGI